MKASAVDHICIAVKDLKAACRTYEQTLGLKPALEYESPEEKIRVVRYLLGGVGLELMEDLDGTGKVAEFIRQRGEGLYLISYRVDDVAAGLTELREKGEPTIDRRPRVLKGMRYAFIQPPKRFNGVLTEIMDGDFKPDS